MGSNYPTRGVIKAVFLDWGNTLVAWHFDHELFVEGHLRGLAALGGRAPSQPVFTQAYTTQVLNKLTSGGDDEIDYAVELGRLFERLGYPADDAAVTRFLVAEHRVWRPTHRLEAPVVELLDGLRDRGLKIGLVSNLFDPPWLVRELFAELGLLERLSAVALSAEGGKRKPHPAIFEAALAQAGVAAVEAVMVGDRLREDIGGAQALGMTAIQARWFEQDESGAAVPETIATTPDDVLRWLDHERTT